MEQKKWAPAALLSVHPVLIFEPVYLPQKEPKTLSIEELRVKLGDREILKNINLEINAGETHILFGPNGSGKTTLLMTIMGYPQYKIISGKIFFKGQDITDMPINERARLGIGMSYQ